MRKDIFIQNESTDIARPVEPDVAGFKVRLWIAGILTGIAFLIFVADRFYTLVKPNLDRVNQVRYENARDAFQEKALQIIDGYGIHSQWMKKRSVRVASIDTFLREEWVINVPRDVPLASVNHDVNLLAREFGGRAFAVENAKTSQVHIHVRFDRLITHSFVFTPKHSLTRSSGSTILMVDGLSTASKSEITKYLSISEPVAAVIPPSVETKDLYATLRGEGKAVVLHLHIYPEGEESRYRLGEDLDKLELRRRVRAILRTFSGANYCYITSERPANLIMEAVNEFLQEGGVKRISTTDIIYLDRLTESGSIVQRMNDLAETAEKNSYALGIIRLEDGAVDFLVEQIALLRKRGKDIIPITMYDK